MLIDIDIILKRGILASVEIECEISSSGYSGDNYDPPELDMFEMTGLVINNVMCFSGIGLTIPQVWYKSGKELVRHGWHDDLIRLIKPLLYDEYYDEWQQLADHELSTPAGGLV